MQGSNPLESILSPPAADPTYQQCSNPAGPWKGKNHTTELIVYQNIKNQSQVELQGVIHLILKE